MHNVCVCVHVYALELFKFVNKVAKINQDVDSVTSKITTEGKKYKQTPTLTIASLLGLKITELLVCAKYTRTCMKNTHTLNRWQTL